MAALESGAHEEALDLVDELVALGQRRRPLRLWGPEVDAPAHVR